MPIRFTARPFRSLLVRSLPAATLFFAVAFPGAAAQSVTAVTPPGGTLGSEIVIHGEDFGTSRAGLAVWLSVDGSPRRAPLRILSVEPERIVARIVRLRPGVEGTLHVARRGGGGGDELPFAVEAPVVASLSPLAVMPGQTVHVTGQHFGTRAPRVLLFDRQAKVVEWSDTAFVFRVPRHVPDGEWAPRVETKAGAAWAPQSLQLSGSAAPAPAVHLLLRAGEFSLDVGPAGIVSTQVGNKIAIDAIASGAQTQQLSLLLPFMAHSSPVPTVLSGTGFGPEPLFFVQQSAGDSGSAIYVAKPGQQPWEVILHGRSHGRLVGRISGVLVLAAGSGPPLIEIQQGRFTAAF